MCLVAVAAPHLGLLAGLPGFVIRDAQQRAEPVTPRQEGARTVKQFTRCTNCRQWYVSSFTAAVETRHGNRCRRDTIWCLRCIDEAEQRSQGASPPETRHPETAAQPSTLPRRAAATTPKATGLSELMREHIELMEQALHDSDDVLLPVVQDFMRRCRDYRQHSEAAEETERLSGHLRYWEAFMRAFHEAS